MVFWNRKKKSVSTSTCVTLTPSPPSEEESPTSKQQTLTLDDYFQAAYDGNLHIIKECIKSGIDKEAKDSVGSTALHFASGKDHLEIVQYLIENCNLDREAKTNNGWTALHFACSNGHLEIVKYLIEKCHVDTEGKTNNGMTALHFASGEGRLESVQYLIETCRVDKEAKNKDGWTALHYASTNGHLDTVIYLIETCHLDPEVKDNKGRSAFDIATTYNNGAVVQYLWKVTPASPKQKEESPTSKPPTPTVKDYLQAAKDGELGKVKECINSDIDKEAKDIYGWTALHWASYYGEWNIVKYLIETCRVNKEAKNNIGQSASDIAVAYNKSEIVQYLLNVTSNPTIATPQQPQVEKTTSEQPMPAAKEILEAAKEGNLVKVKYCVNKGVDKDAKDYDGWTALHYATWKGHLEIVQYLIETCQLDKEAKINEGSTALHIAIRNDHLNIVTYLIETGHVNKEIRNNNGQSAYDVAVANYQTDIVKYLEDLTAFAVVDNEVTRNASSSASTLQKQEEPKKPASIATTVYEPINAEEPRTKSTVTLNELKSSEQNENLIEEFLDAAKNGSLDIVKKCIANGVDKEATNNRGYTSLHISSDNGHLEIVKFLIETCQVNKEAQSNGGWTALHFASYNGDLDMVRYLIETSHADKEKRTNSGQTAHDFALKNNKSSIAEYLMMATTILSAFNDKENGLDQEDGDKAPDQVRLFQY